MTFFGMKEAEAAVLVRTVAGDHLDREGIQTALARAAWTGIAEPGDAIAGIVVSALGPVAAFEGLVTEWTAGQWSASLESSRDEATNPRGSGFDFDAPTEHQLGEAIARWSPRMKPESIFGSLRQAARCGARLLTPESSSWPRSVDDLGASSPLALWIRGAEDALAALHDSIALVGARAATAYGEHLAMEAAAGLVDRGYAIVSGAAYGIDGMAHRAALASQGTTIAFLAGGVDRFYPSGHDALLGKIVDAGAVISELPCGQPPTRWRFLQRNRLIAAASRATVVVEAGWRSGSLNTANHAAALGRPLGVFPGPVTSAASAGCHRLIRERDAILVTSAEEIAELAPTDTRAPRSDQVQDRDGRSAAARPSAEIRLLDALSVSAPRQTSDLAARAGLSLSDVQSALAVLELDELVEERERGWIKRRQPPQAKAQGRGR